jgi:hypothetical protein
MEFPGLQALQLLADVVVVVVLLVVLSEWDRRPKDLIHPLGRVSRAQPEAAVVHWQGPNPADLVRTAESHL